jgi:hypothetical protein
VSPLSLRCACWEQFLGHADISLSDAYNNMAYPVTADSMNLVTVLDHPVLSLMWDAHVQKEMSGENTAFYRAARAFQSWAVLSTHVFAWRPCMLVFDFWPVSGLRKHGRHQGGGATDI